MVTKISSPPKHYPFLDGFRAIAIVMVLSHHARRGFDLDHLFSHCVVVMNWVYFNCEKYLGIDLTAFYYLLQRMISQFKGILGMEMFFVISGFLITGILLKDNLEGVSVKKFYLRRLFKIYPSYMLMLLVSLLVYGIQQRATLGEIGMLFFHHALFLQNYFPQVAVFGHTWSMVVIEQFYLACPLVMLAVCRLFKTVEDRRHVLIGICLVLMVVTPLVRLLYLTSEQALLSWPLASPVPFWTITYHLDALAFGCLLGLSERVLRERLRNRMFGLACWAAGAAIYIVLFFFLDWSYFWGDWFLYTLGYLGFGLLLVGAFNGIAVFARLKPLQWMGRHTYGIYLWHYLVLMFFQQFLGTVSTVVLVTLYFFSSIFVGVVSSKTVEWYFLKLRDRLT